MKFTPSGSKTTRPYEILVSVLLIGGLGLDLVTPRGYSDWVFYVLAIVLSMRVISGRKMLAAATSASVFLVLGFIFSPPGWQFWASVYSRSLGLVLVWAAFWVGNRWRSLDERTARAHRALRTLSECNQVMVRAQSEPQLLSRVCRALVEVGGYRMAWVGYAQPDDLKSVRTVASSGDEDGYLKAARITWSDDERGRGPTGLAIRSGEVQIARDIHQDPKFAPWREEALRRGYASSIALPLNLDSGRLGALMLYSHLRDAFDPDEVQLLTELSNDLAFGIQALRTRAERFRSEDELRRASAYNRSLLEASLDPLVTVTREGIVTDANSAAEHVTGLLRNDFVGTDFSDYFTDPAKARQACLKAFAKGAISNCELEIRHRSGRITPVLYNASVYRDDEGDVIGVVAAARDVTEKKKAEEALRRERRRLYDILETLPAYVILLSPDYHVPFANRVFRERFGESGGLRCYEYLFKRGSPCEICESFKVLKTNASLEWEWTGPDSRNYQIYDFPFVDEDGSTLILEMGLDITERKRAEEALVKLQKAVDASGEVVFMTDRDGVFTFINPEFTRVFGYTPEEVVGKATPRVLKSGKMAQEFYAGFWNQLLHQEVVRADFINKTKDQRLVNMEVSVNPILGDRGEISGFLAIQRDVSARKQLEEQLRQAQKMEAVGQLAGGVAHDFNNLLTVINGYSELLREGPESVDDERAFLKEIQHAGERASELTRQLLAFSRKQVTQPVVLDLNAAVQRAQKMLERVMGEDVRLVTRFFESSCNIKADAGQIEQVLMNLAVNARDAMPKGGALTIETAAVSLDDTFVQIHPGVKPGDHVLLAVSDSGCGMDTETQSHIFEPFFTTKGQGKGTGLGLSTVYGIVEQNGGHIIVFSEVGKGTTFNIYFKRVDEPALRKQAGVVEVCSQTGNETVLLVEDEPSVRAFAQEVLKGKGYTVLTAASAEEALLVSRRDPAEIALLLTDVIMPGMNGKELAERLRLSRPTVKVLFISGYTGEAISQHGILDERVSFLPKPFSPRDLLAKVRQTLDSPRS